ncbi:uncharacterized protein FPRO_01819 [Fusarium proliferatum ET1]|uniref:C2H2-type domain-containing protein n=1 Tax=Fusarium proliferatum (strain ET1) TaxID=1227346 RepID=A0A1L7V4B8_FUSPR|nr:uncharacterized protein FPRO_01819 [Fusarium proliferatum ET1]CZR33269.1 uncharacterized protein FPRO_01819 [Fusarium proliferatum ET1]
MERTMVRAIRRKLKGSDEESNEESDEENDQENDEESCEEGNEENDEESDKESVPDLVENTGENSWWALFNQDNISDESLSYSDFQNFDSYDEDDMSDQSVVSRCYSDDKFQCPGCETRFDSLSSMIRHAEGNKCSANITQDPIKAFMSEVRRRMIEGELF